MSILQFKRRRLIIALVTIWLITAIFINTTAFAQKIQFSQSIPDALACIPNSDPADAETYLLTILWLQSQASPKAHAMVFNGHSTDCFDVGLASYQLDTNSNVLSYFDSETSIVLPRQLVVFDIKAPCRGHLNLFIGSVLFDPPFNYGERSLRSKDYALPITECQPPPGDTLTPTSTRMNTATPTATNSPTASATPSVTASSTNTSTPTATPTVTNSPTASTTPSATASSTNTSTPTVPAAPTASTTPTPTSTDTVDTLTPTPTSTATPHLLTHKGVEIFRDSPVTPIPSMVQPGDRIVYTVLITNSGQSDAREVVITDPIPLDTVFLPGTAQTNGQLTSIGQTVAAVMDKLFPGDIFSLTFTVILRQNPDELEIVNEAIVLAQGSDPPDPSVLLWVDSDGNGIPDIMEVTLKYYLPIILMNFSD